MSAIKLLKEAREVIASCANRMDQHNYWLMMRGEDNPQLLKTLERIDALLKTGGWIPVRVKEPKKKDADCLGYVLCLYENHRGIVQWDWLKTPIAHKKNAMWQPLPPLPEDKHDNR